MDFYSLSVFIFFGILFLIIYKDRKNIEVQGLMLIRRTKVGIRILDKLSKLMLFWKILGTIGIFVIIFLMFEGIISLVKYSELIITGAVTIPGVGFLLPSAKSQVEAGPGYILMPFWFWLMAIMSVLVPHEMFHGIMSRVEKIRVKATGLLLLVILPGAFVEPDEKQLKKSRLISKFRVFAAGSLANFLVYLILFYGTSTIIWPYFVPGPIMLNEINMTSPAEQFGLKAGMVITEINGKPVKATYNEFFGGMNYLSDEMGKAKPGDKVSLVANGTRFDIVLGSNPENKTVPYLGIIYQPVTRVEATKLNSLFGLLTWMWIINYAIAVFNSLPISILDGGLVVQAIVEKINKKHAGKIMHAITLIVLLLLAFNFFAPFLLQVVLPPS